MLRSKKSNAPDSKYWYVTFADSRMSDTLERCRHQADKMGVFGRNIRCLDENDLDADFRELMKDRLVKGSRGFGYWCWKPQSILQVLREMKDGDILLYADAGSHLRKKGLPKLMEYFALADKHGMVAFQARALGEAARNDFSQHFLPERQWSTTDIIKYFGVEGNESVLDSGQIGATVVVVRKEERSVNLINQWVSMFREHFELCDDTPSVLPNAPDFRENRYDQSVLSLLCKTNGVYTLSCAEYVLIEEFMPEGGNRKFWPARWSDISDRPIWGVRDLGKYTKFVACPDWLKPILGKQGRKFASRIYESVKWMFRRPKA